MILYFIIPLFLTFLIIRILAYSFHDFENYATKNEKSKTFTGWLRIKTGFDWHHFYFGILILLITLSFILLFGLIKFNVVLLAVGISMVVDQIVPIINRKANYFSFKNLLMSFIFHIVVVGIFLIMYNN